MNKKIVILSMMVFLLFLTVGCGDDNKPIDNNLTNNQKQEDAINNEKLEKDNENSQKSDEFIAQIMFNGSSTLAPVIASISTNFIEEFVTWDKVDSSFPNKDIAVYVSAGGSGQGVKSVIDKTSDFGMTARSIKDSEKEKMPNLQEFVIGIDALTLSVNPDNPILNIKDNLTTDEIIKIFSGEYAKWSDVDSTLPSTEIIVVTRDIGGGAHEVFQSKIMGDVQVKSDAIQAPSMGALVTKVIENENAIGYASFGIVNQNIGKITPLKVNGVDPTKENIVSGEYIIQRPLIAIINDELTKQQKYFVDYLMSDDGLAVVESMGFIPYK